MLRIKTEDDTTVFFRLWKHHCWVDQQSVLGPTARPAPLPECFIHIQGELWQLAHWVAVSLAQGRLRLTTMTLNFNGWAVKERLARLQNQRKIPL